MVIQFPDLISRPQPTHKIKPNAPPPALIPRPTLISEEEKNARKESLSICVERQEERSIIKALVVLESRKVSFRKVGKAAEDALAEDLPVMPSPWLIYLDVSSLLMEGKRKVSCENKKSWFLERKTAHCESCRQRLTLSPSPLRLASNAEQEDLRTLRIQMQCQMWLLYRFSFDSLRGMLLNRGRRM